MADDISKGFRGEVTTGPFAGLVATIVEVRGDQLRASLEIFGRTTVVDLDRACFAPVAAPPDPVEEKLAWTLGHAREHRTWWAAHARAAASHDDVALAALHAEHLAYLAALDRDGDAESVALARLRDDPDDPEHGAAAWLARAEACKQALVALDVPTTEAAIDLRLRAEAAWRALDDARHADPLAGTSPIATDAALEAQIAAAPDDAAPYLVYADFLQQRGDPRGQLIALGDDPDALARHLERHERYFVGGLASAIADKAVELDWHTGFIRKARVAVTRAHENRGIAQAPLVATLLALPSARFMRALSIGCASVHEDGVPAAIVAALASAGTRPLVTRLELTTNGDEEMLSWTETGELAPVWAVFPNLTALAIEAGTIRLGDGFDDAALPHLTDLELHTCDLDERTLQQLRASTWTSLDRLDLWFGDPGRGAPTALPAAEPFITGDLAPNVTRLAIANAHDAAEVVAALLASARFDRLVELDVSRGTLDDDGARPLLHALRDGRAPHLRVLDLDETYVTAAALAALVQARPDLDVRSRWQRTPDTYEGVVQPRYVSVGE